VSSQLSFSDDNNYVETGNRSQTVNTYEQEIDATYTYRSERKPFVVVNDVNIINEIETGTFNYDDVIDNVMDCSVRIAAHMGDILYDLSTFVEHGESSENVAYWEAVRFLDSSQYRESVDDYIEGLCDECVRNAMYDDFMEIFNDNYVFNQYIDVSVNRLGDYYACVKAYDRYNNVFVNKADKSAKVAAAPIVIDIYDGYAESGNDEVFYHSNIDGIMCDSSMICDLMDMCDVIPLYPNNYHMYNYVYDMENDRIEFDNISYAIDTPKNNDYLMLDNCTEICTGMTYDASPGVMVLSMLDENPDKIYLYDSSNHAIDINICVFDMVELQDVGNFGPYRIIESYRQNAVDDVNYGDDSYIKVACTDTSLLDYVNDRRYRTYVKNVNEYPLIGYDGIYNVTNDYDRNVCYVDFGDSIPRFNLKDVVKVRYYMGVDVSSGRGEIINEVAYRIVDIEKVDFEIVGFKYVYTLNGLVDMVLIDRDDVTPVLMYAATSMVRYVTRVEGDGFEYNYAVGNGTYLIRDRFSYNSTMMFLDDYIDDTYSGIVYDYDPDELKAVWFDVFDAFEPDNMDLYMYRDFPVSVDIDKPVILGTSDINEVFDGAYHTEWTWKCETFDDTTNWRNHTNVIGKEKLFRSTNDYLSVRPRYAGPQDIYADCIDKFGNKVTANGSGHLFVRG